MRIRIITFFSCFSIFLLEACVGQPLNSKDKYFASDTLKSEWIPVLDSFLYKKYNQTEIVFKSIFPIEKNGEIKYDTSFKNTLVIQQKDSLQRDSINKYIDVNSIKYCDSLLTFISDKKYVYYFKSTSDGGEMFLVQDASPDSFFRIGNSDFAKDKEHVFWRNVLLKKLDPQKTNLVPSVNKRHSSYYVKDDKTVYYLDIEIPDADPKSFQLIGIDNTLAKDKGQYYQSGIAIGK